MRQVPPIAKQPLARSIPLAKVEVEFVPVTFKYVVWRPAAKVEVAVVEVAVMYRTVGLDEELRERVPPSEYIQPWPKEVAPVPPYKTPTEVVAETIPALAWSGPFRVETVNPPLNV